MTHTALLSMIVSLFCTAAAGCASDAGPTVRAANQDTAAIEQPFRVDPSLCTRWTQCYLGCAAMPCDDEATCAAQQAAYAACDVDNAPAPDYCPQPL